MIRGDGVDGKKRPYSRKVVVVVEKAARKTKTKSRRFIYKEFRRASKWEQNLVVDVKCLVSARVEKKNGNAFFLLVISKSCVLFEFLIFFLVFFCFPIYPLLCAIHLCRLSKTHFYVCNNQRSHSFLFSCPSLCVVYVVCHLVRLSR